MKKHSSASPSFFSLEERMVHLLMYKGDFLQDPGLFHGKTGLVLFFASYYKVTSNQIYESVADEFMEQVTDTLSKTLPVGLARGLCGIGWAIEYLIQHKMMEGNSMDICEEIDHQLLEKDPRRITDLSVENGIEGILHYVLAHLAGAQKTGNMLPFDQTYLADLYNNLCRIYAMPGITASLSALIKDYQNFYTDQKPITYQPVITPFLCPVEPDSSKLTSYPLGLKEGITGILFEKLLKSCAE